MAADVGRPLSLSLPLTLGHLPIKVAHDFDNLLSDSDAIRRRVAERFGTGSAEPFDLFPGDLFPAVFCVRRKQKD